MSDAKTVTFTNEVSGETIGAYAGSDLAEVLFNDADWSTDQPADAVTVASKTQKVSADADLSPLTLPELRQIAAQRGVEHPEAIESHGEFVAALEALAAPEQPEAVTTITVEANGGDPNAQGEEPEAPVATFTSDKARDLAGDRVLEPGAGSGKDGAYTVADVEGLDKA